MIYTASHNSIYDTTTNAALDASTNAVLANIVWDLHAFDYFLIRIGGTDYWTGAPNSDYDSINNDQLAYILNSELAGIITSDVLMAESLSIEHEIDGRSSASLTIYDINGVYFFNERQEIIITSPDSDREFAGVLQSCEETRIPGTPIVYHALTATDFTAMLDWRLCDYAAENKYAGDAIKEIMGTYLAEEGITEGYIAFGELLTEISISNQPISTGFQKLAEACCGYIFYVDYNLKLYFHDRSFYPATWNIADGNDILSGTLTVTRNNPVYRNSETLIGGFEETSLQTEIFLGDGTTKTFPLAYPFCRSSSVSVGGVAQTVGTKGASTGFNVYFAANSETMTFDSGIAAPGAGVAIIVAYYGLWRSKTKQYDDTKIASNKVRQGIGSGKIEHVTIDETLTSIDAASEYANAKIDLYAVDGISIQYKTRRSGLAAGTLQHIEYARLDDDFLITRISVEDQDNFRTYAVEAVSGPVNKTWENFFSSQFTPIYTIREGINEDGVRNVYNFSHEYVDSDRPDIFGHAGFGDGGARNSEWDASLNSILDDLSNVSVARAFAHTVMLVSDTNWPCFAPADRVSHIELWKAGDHYRKAHTQVTGDTTEDINSYTYISPGEANGAIDHITLWGGDVATATAGTGVSIATDDFAYDKTPLHSLQLNVNYKRGIPDVLFFGDSITGYAGYAQAIRDAYTCVATQIAIPSTGIQQQGYDQLYTIDPADYDRIFTTYGMNDFIALKNTYSASVVAGITALLAYACLRNDEKVLWSSAGMTYGGSWSDGDGVKCTTANGATASFAVFGPNIIIVTDQHASGGGSFSVSIDGAPHSTINMTGCGYPIAPMATIITGLAVSAHAVILTAVSGGADKCNFAFAAGISDTYPCQGPAVICGGCIRMGATGYATYGGSDAEMATFNSATEGAVKTLRDMGLPITYLNLSTYDSNLPAHVTDGVHPSETGHADIARYFLSMVG